jgi:hypothetical protein
MKLRCWYNDGQNEFSKPLIVGEVNFGGAFGAM